MAKKTSTCYCVFSLFYALKLGYNDYGYSHVMLSIIVRVKHCTFFQYLFNVFLNKISNIVSWVSHELFTVKLITELYSISFKH